MADIISKASRSRNMSAIKSKDTKPEIYFRKILFKRGLRYRKNVSRIFGHPDLFLAKYRTAVFVHGCFWHRHPHCKFAYTPRSNTDFWNDKFSKNISRDVKVKATLQSSGIKCLVVWECTIRKMQKDPIKEKEICNMALDFIKSNELYCEL